MREPEPETLEAARRGDKDAFEELVRQFLPAVHRLAWHLVRDAPTAEDVTQDTFLSAYRAIGRFRIGEMFSTWIFRIARNRSIDALRRRRPALELFAANVPSVPPDDPATRAWLREAIDALPRELRETFLLVEVLGFSYPETAKVMGVPGGTVKSRMHRARRALVADLEAEGRADEM